METVCAVNVTTPPQRVHDQFFVSLLEIAFPDDLCPRPDAASDIDVLDLPCYNKYIDVDSVIHIINTHIRGLEVFSRFSHIRELLCSCRTNISRSTVGFEILVFIPIIISRVPRHLSSFLMKAGLT